MADYRDGELPHHRVYRKKLQYLKDFVKLEGVLSGLLGDYIINKAAYERLTATNRYSGESAATEELFTGHLMRNPDPESFWKLLSVLKSTSNGSVAKDLETEYKKVNGEDQGNTTSQGGPNVPKPKIPPAANDAVQSSTVRHTEGEVQPAASQSGVTPKRPSTEGAGSGALNIDEEEDTDKMKIHVTHININEPMIQRQLQDEQGVYKLHRRPRGKAVILNIQHFIGGHEREGSQSDATNLENLLQQLHFDTVVYADLKAQEIKDMIREEKEKIQPEDEAFILCALSHGGEELEKDYILGADLEKVFVKRDLYEPFDGNNSPDLRGKPKLFIIQACRGGDKTRGVEVMDQYPETEEEDVCRMIHEHSDVLFARSTISENVSFRNRVLGSRFIRTLVRVFAAQAHTKHIVDMLTEVRRKVNDSTTSHYVQLTEDTVRLEKDFYFFPGYPKE